MTNPKENPDHTSLRNSIRNLSTRKFSSGSSLCRMHHTTFSFSVASGISYRRNTTERIKMVENMIKQCKDNH